ncbi:Urease accessory protein UreD [Roseobacter fucihabitans]|uniref:Urease accessory protein UreD n=1 Tax=Roseobacter fucihabitans TaxID=1537242 RepID=A0ABZ2BT33_9RHOB|nr:urease accessory protein UreD [Roseobacter litoralis]MBC6965401.1 Urease accessory protein UreD [Roseobacter litoralis]
MRTPTLLDQPRAIGTAMVSSKQRAGHSHIDDLHQSGAFKLLFPRRAGPLEAILINTAGGITGGDDFTLSATAGDGSHLCVTTQAAERAYRSQPGQTGHLGTRLKVAADARLDWLPQETILFEGCALRRSLDVDLAAGARFLMVEPILFGRRAMGEELHDVRFEDRISIRQAGDILYRDGLSLHGDVAAMLERPAIAGGAGAMASIVFVTPEAEGHLAPVRDMLGPKGGASLLRPGVLVARLLGEDGYGLRKTLLPILDRLSDNKLPQSWRL